MHPSIYRVGATNGDIFPIILDYGGIRLERQIGLLKIDTSSLKAYWQTTAHDEFITVNWAEILQYQGYELEEEELKEYYNEDLTDDGYSNYFDHNSQLLWTDVWYADNILCGLSKGTQTSKRSKGWDEVLLVRLVNRDSKFKFNDILYEADQDDAYDDNTYPPISLTWNLSTPICLLHQYPKSTNDIIISLAYNLVKDEFVEIDVPKGKEGYEMSVIIKDKIVLGKHIASTRSTSLLIVKIL